MKGSKTSKQLADFQEKHNALLTRIQNWREVQYIYTPHIVSLISQALRPETNEPAALVSPPSETPLKIYCCSYPLLCHLTFVLSQSSKKFVSWNDASMNLKQTMLLLISDASDRLSRDFGFSNV